MTNSPDRRVYFANDTKNVRDALLKRLNERNFPHDLRYNRSFFSTLASECLDIFGPNYVTVWEPANNDWFRILGCEPASLGSFNLNEFVDRTQANAQAAISEREIKSVYAKNAYGGLPFSDSLPSDTALTSIPVSYSQHDVQGHFVVNLHFTDMRAPSSRVDSGNTSLICELIGQLYKHFISSQSELLRESLRVARNESLGASSVLSLVRPCLEKTTGAIGLSILTLRNSETEGERRNSVEFEFAMGAIPTRTFNSHNTSIGSWLDERCKGCEPNSEERRRLLAWLDDITHGIADSGIFSQCKHRSHKERRGVRFFDEMITPITWDDDTTIGFLWCYADPAKAIGSNNFCNADLETIRLVGAEIAPFLKRLIDIRARTSLLRVFEAATIATSSASLIESLTTIIRDIVTSLNTSIGSIYLLDRQSHQLVMRAAAGWNESLVDQATYQMGEGLTGWIASNRNILRFDNHDEMIRDPRFSGKHDHLIWKGSGARCETFLGVPIVFRDEVLGVLKLGNVRRTEAHRDDRFTEEDVQTTRAIAALLALLIQAAKRKEINELWERAISQTALAMLNESSETIVLQIAKHTLEELGISCMLSVVEGETGDIVGYFATGTKWPRILSVTRRSAIGEDILAVCLRSNKPEFIGSVSRDPRCNIEAAQLAEIESFYVLPLRVGEERIGTLQIDVPAPFTAGQEHTNVIHALASCIAYAVSRVRAQETSIRLASDTLSSGRAVATDLTMALAAHNVGHQIDNVIRTFEDNKKEVSRELMPIIAGAVGQLRRIESDLKKYVSPDVFWQMDPCDIRRETGLLLQDYQVLFRSRKCEVSMVSAEIPVMNRLPISVFREILRELLTNAVDAGATRIAVSVQSFDDYPIADDMCAPVICVDVSDNGSGFDNDVFFNAFEPRESTKSNGSGMGLFFCRRFANGFGGEMEVYRDYKDGYTTTMRIVLPRRS